ncbi:hypothetical protein ABBQ32_012372 [Trebouxia sp. C0010 RCD-2024]
MPNPTATLTVSGGTLLNTLSIAGNTVIGTTSSDTLAVNAAITFAAAVIANAPVSITAGNSLAALGNTVIGTDASNTLTVAAVTTFGAAVIANAPVTVSAGNAFAASGNVVLGTNSSNTVSVSSPTTFSTSAALTANGNVILGAGPTQTLTVKATSTLAAPVTANAAVTIPNGNLFSALGNVVVGTSSANTLAIYATTTFNTGLQMYSSSATASNSAVMGFQRQNNGGAVTSGFTLGSILFSGYDGSVQGPTAQIRSQFTASSHVLQLAVPVNDATGKWGGSLIFSTSTAGTSSASTSTQLVDRLTIDSSGLATVSGSIAMPSSTGTLTVAGGTLLNTLSTSGNTAIGTTSSQTLVVNAATTFAAAVIANAPVTVSAGNAFTASGNATIGSSNANSLMVSANTTFAGSATFNQAFQLYSNSSSSGSGAVLGFLRQNSEAAVAAGFTLGSILFSGYDGAMQGPTAQIRSVFTDATGKLGGSLIFSTSSIGSLSTGSSQLVDRLTIDSSGLATLSGSLAMPSPTGTLTVSGNAVIGTTSSQSLVVDAATTFAAAVIANAPVTVSAGNALTASGNVALGTDSSNTVSVSSPTTFSSLASLTANGNTVLGAGSTQTLTVRATSTLAAPVTANAAVTIPNGNLFSALGNVVVGTSSANTLAVYATTTFNTGLQMYSSSATASNSAVMGFQRQNNGGAVTSGFTLGSILFSGYDGSVQGPTAQIRSQFTASSHVLQLAVPVNDATGKWGGSLIFSTSTAGTSSASTSTQLVDRLTIDSSGLATVSGSIAMPSSTGTLTVAGGTLLNTLSTSGNTAIGTTSSQTLVVNAATTFAAAVIANAPVTVSAGNAFTASGNANIGSSNANSLMVSANTTFAGSATFNQAFQLYSNSSSPGSGVVLGFLRQNSGAAVAAGFTLGSILFSGYDGAMQGPTAQIRSVFTDATGKLGGSLIFSTSSTGSLSTGSSQLVDRLTIDSSGLATLSGSLAMPSPTGTLTVSGNAVIGTTSSQSLVVDAATTFAAAVIANAPVTVSAGNAFTASGNVALGTDSSNTVSVSSPTTFSSLASLTANGNTVLGAGSTQTLTVRATSTLAAPVTANAAVTIPNGNLFSALGNVVVGTSSANTLAVYATTTFNTGLQMYSSSATASNSAVMGFQRQNNGGAVTSGFTLGSILFSGYDGSVQGPTAQIRSQFTVSIHLV